MCYKEPHSKANGAAHLESLFWDLGRLRDLNGDVVITNNFYLKTVLQEEWHRVLKHRPISQLNPQNWTSSAAMSSPAVRRGFSEIQGKLVLLTALALWRRLPAKEKKKGWGGREGAVTNQHTEIHPSPESSGSSRMVPRSGAAPCCQQREATPQTRHPAVKHRDEPPSSEEILFRASSNLPPAGPAELGLLFFRVFPSPELLPRRLRRPPHLWARERRRAWLESSGETGHLGAPRTVSAWGVPSHSSPWATTRMMEPNSISGVTEQGATSPGQAAEQIPLVAASPVKHFTVWYFKFAW